MGGCTAGLFQGHCGAPVTVWHQREDTSRAGEGEAGQGCWMGPAWCGGSMHDVAAQQYHRTAHRRTAQPRKRLRTAAPLSLQTAQSQSLARACRPAPAAAPPPAPTRQSWLQERRGGAKSRAPVRVCSAACTWGQIIGAHKAPTGAPKRPQKHSIAQSGGPSGRHTLPHWLPAGPQEGVVQEGWPRYRKPEGAVLAVPLGQVRRVG